MKTLEIMFDDLSEEAQRQFLEFQGLEDSKDGNYDIVPIAVLSQKMIASIQTTVDLYGHIVPGANRSILDSLD